MGAKVDLEAMKRTRQIRGLLKKAHANLIESQRDLKDGVDTRISKLQSKLGEAQKKMNRSVRVMDDQESRLERCTRKLGVLSLPDEK